MKRKILTGRLLALALLAATPILPAAGANPDERAELTNQAKASIAALASTLKSELMAAIDTGGVPGAIDVCHSRAPAIAREISEQQGLEVSRVSQRNRNPENAPTDWQAAVLENFEARRKAGDDPSSMTWQEVVETDGGRAFRFMKAIPTGGLCLRCHGKNLAPEVADSIARLYPDDQATGFEAGDIRGAFVVTKNLD